MTELLTHPVTPLAIGVLLLLVLPKGPGRIVMLVAPLVALVNVLGVEPGELRTLNFLSYELTVLRGDSLARPFALVFTLAAFAASLYGYATQNHLERIGALAYAASAIGVVYAGDLLTFFVFWELKAITATLVIMARRTTLSDRAGMRYLFVHIVGGKLLLAGILLHYADTGSLAFTQMEPSLATAMILVACLISAAMPPLHAWLADAYPQAGIAGTVFLAAYTTKAAVYALARGFAGWEILIYLGVFMAAYGVTYAMMENDIRRLLSYHIVSQVGFMVTAVGIGTELAVNGAVGHALTNIFAKGLLLMGAGAVLYATGSQKAHLLGGLYNRMRGVFWLYLIGAAAISGFPLFSGFVSKEIVIESAYSLNLTWVVIGLKIVSVGTFISAGLKLPYAAFFGDDGPGPKTNDHARIRVTSVPKTMLLGMGVLALGNVAIGVFPQLLTDILPYATDINVFRGYKVFETLQILVFTGAGFYLLNHIIHPKAKVSADTDVVYRRVPQALAQTFSTGRTNGSRQQAQSVSVKLLDLAITPFRVHTGQVPITPMWRLGGIFMFTAVVILLTSVLT
jgi:multicomponent Na+:H+ antiporter subunit D